MHDVLHLRAEAVASTKWCTQKRLNSMKLTRPDPSCDDIVRAGGVILHLRLDATRSVLRPSPRPHIDEWRGVRRGEGGG